MIAMTTSNSIKVKAFGDRRVGRTCLFILANHAR